jgi:hypothetical protein
MKKKMHKDIFKIGSTKFDIHNLRAVETISIVIVGILSITAGTIYGSMLF